MDREENTKKLTSAICQAIDEYFTGKIDYYWLIGFVTRYIKVKAIHMSGNKTAGARMLGINRTTLYESLKQ